MKTTQKILKKIHMTVNPNINPHLTVKATYRQASLALTAGGFMLLCEANLLRSASICRNTISKGVLKP